MKRVLPFLAIGVVLLLAGGLIYQVGTPRLVRVEPASGSVDVAAGSRIRLTFSRSMQPESVIQHLRIVPNLAGEFSWEGKTLVFDPQRNLPGGSKIQILLEPGSRASGLLALPVRSAYRGEFTVANPHLVYLYPADGPADLYALQPETGKIERLTYTSTGILDYDANAELNTLVYSSANALGGSDLYRLDLGITQPLDTLATTNVYTVTLLLKCDQADCRAPRLSPQGEYLAYEKTVSIENGGTGYPQVWISLLSKEMKPQGKALLAGAPEQQTIQPLWSSQGLLVVYAPSLDAYLFFDPHRDVNKLVEIARYANSTGEIGNWSPDGKSFVAPEIDFVQVDMPGGQVEPDLVNASRLMRFQLADETVQNLSGNDLVDDLSPAYSPDELAIAFARRFLNITRWTPGRQLWVMSIAKDGSVGEAYPLTNDPNFNHYDLAWNPEGDRLAYVRFNQTTLSDPPEIWLIDPANGETQQLVVGGYLPAWIP